LSYAPGLRAECSRAAGNAHLTRSRSEASFEGSLEWDRRERIPLLHKDPTRLPRVHRRALGLLFTVLAAGLGSIAVLSALEGGRAWVIALAAAALALWMADLARRALRRP